MTQRYEQQPHPVPPDATEVILVRHGASAAYIPGEPMEMLEGIGNPALAPAGVEQAEAVASRLAGEPIKAIYCSTLQRTQQTAAPLAARLGLEPRALEDLREISLGEWEGGELRVRARAGDPLFVELMAKERWDVIPGAEPMEEAAVRMRRGFDQVVAETGPGLVAVFVHGGVITELCRQFAESRPFAFLFVDNASLTRVIAIADGRVMLRSFNDTAHLA